MSPRPRLVIGMPEWDEDEPLPEPPDERAEPLPSRPAEKTRAPSGSPPYSPASVIDVWGREGPLVHEPTGLEALDTATGGGPPYGTRWYLAGAPDAGKTAGLVQIAHVYAKRGIAVGLLAVDEEASDVVTRLAQRSGHSRRACEERAPGTLDRLRRELGQLPLRIYDAAWTIERAAADLAAWARERGDTRCMLGVDSIQTVRCDAELAGEREMGAPQAIEARVHALRAVATEHRLIAIATSEMSRAAYRSRATRENVDALAASKWSGAIEYSARVLLALRSVPDHPELVEVEIAKNKHGPPRPPIYLRIDRASQQLAETEAPAVDEERAADRDDARVAAADGRTRRDAARVAVALERSPGLSARLVQRCVPGIGEGRVTAALVALGPAVVRVLGPGRRQGHYLDGRHVPDAVLRELGAEDRARVAAARPPAPNESGTGESDGAPCA